VNDIAIVTCYMGRLPNYFDVWLKSCKYNPDVDFILVTDQNIAIEPCNVRVVHLDLPAVKKLADEKLSLETALTRPYKLCDFKPVFGVLFEEHLQGYRYWGYCDIDVVFGKLRSFLTDEILAAYDRVLYLGHLCICKNTKEVNERYKLPGATCNYVQSFTTERICCFDEWSGMYAIYKKNHFPMYEERIEADISCMYHRMRIARSGVNYTHQLFFWDNGEVKRAFYDDGEVKYESFAYIHFKRRPMSTEHVDAKNAKPFAILPDGFRNLDSTQIDLETIKKYNPYKGRLYEWFELVRYKATKEHGARLKRKLGLR
jgi:hypothetical protein